MPRDFLDPSSEELKVVLVDAATLRKAEKLIESWEHRNAEGAEIPFDNIVDRLTGSDPSGTDYILTRPAKCPNCRLEVLEKTLIEPHNRSMPRTYSSIDKIRDELTWCGSKSHGY